MARFLPVAPHDVTQKLFFDHRHSSSISRDIFMLAHDVVQHPKEWANLSKAWIWNTSYSILDNSVIELQAAVDTEMVANALEISRARVVVLPDVLERGAESLKATLDAYDDWVSRFGNYWDPGKGQAELMFVPQGETLEDWIRCLELGLRSMEYNLPLWIGIPRNTPGRIVHSRTALIEVVKSLYPTAKIHLLGFSDNMVDDLISARHRGTTTIDSAVPLRMKPFELSGDPGPRGDWWENHEVTDQMVANVFHAQKIFRD